ncbi:Pycsar system effector family protein [Streptomyces sp. NPDC059176]|uniref:Pycsar system effector family protein n=1 Tax=unclassified Streptomyces TaxID=2593676 RepID=UPI00369E3E44
MPASGAVSPEAEEKAVDTAWRVHAAVGEWTARVDAKASFALTLESAAGAGIIALSGNGNIFFGPHGWVVRCLLWSGCASILVAAVLAALVVTPRLRTSDLRAEAPDNFVYFGHLMHREAEELAESLRRAEPLPVLSRQLIIMSRIAWTKHRHLQSSLVSFALGLALVVLAAVSA